MHSRPRTGNILGGINPTDWLFFIPRFSVRYYLSAIKESIESKTHRLAAISRTRCRPSWLLCCVFVKRTGERDALALLFCSLRAPEWKKRSAHKIIAPGVAFCWQRGLFKFSGWPCTRTLFMVLFRSFYHIPATRISLDVYILDVFVVSTFNGFQIRKANKRNTSFYCRFCQLILRRPRLFFYNSRPWLETLYLPFASLPSWRGESPISVWVYSIKNNAGWAAQ
jgi:hypothetical protein